MASRHPDRSPGPDPAPSSRRDFLQQAAGIAAGVAALAPTAWAADPPTASASPLPTIRLGPHEVTRLIIGGNPIYGHSHFNRLFEPAPDRLAHARAGAGPAAALRAVRASTPGRTATPSGPSRTWTATASQGGTMHWLCLGKPDWDQHPEHIDDAARHKPIGIAPHGALNERLHRAEEVRRADRPAEAHPRPGGAGRAVGPRPDADRGGRGAGLGRRLLHVLPLLPDPARRRSTGSSWARTCRWARSTCPSDPPRMFRAIRATKKPCLAYKVLAAGRRIGSPAEVRRCFEEAFAGIKPTDAVIVGMYQQFGDQVGEDAALVREIGSHGG